MAAKKTTSPPASQEPPPDTAAQASPPAEWTDPHQCLRCESERHGPPIAEQTQAYSDIDDKTGRPYTHIIRSRVKCLDCGQIRMVRSYRNESPAGGRGKKASSHLQQAAP